MDKRQDEFKDCKNQNELPTHMNQQNSPFNHSNNANGSIKHQGREHYSTGANK